MTEEHSIENGNSSKEPASLSHHEENGNSSAQTHTVNVTIATKEELPVIADITTLDSKINVNHGKVKEQCSCRKVIMNQMDEYVVNELLREVNYIANNPSVKFRRIFLFKKSIPSH